MSSANGDAGRSLPRKAFFGYAVGFLGPNALLSLVNVLLVNYYMLVVGLDPVLSGAGLSLGLVTYAVLSLVFGNLSDNASGGLARKHGKRRPFMALALPPMAVFFALLWVPPVKPATFWAPDWATAAWLWTFSVAFHAAFSAFSPPYWALMAEITKDQDERVKLSVAQNLINLVGIVVSVLVPIVLFSAVETSAGGEFSDALFYGLGPNSDGVKIIAQMALLGAAFAVTSVTTVLVTCMTVPEAPASARPAVKPSFREFLKEVAHPVTRDRSHAWYQGANFSFNVALRVIMAYVLIFVGDQMGLRGAEWFAFTGLVTGAAVAGFVAWDRLKTTVGLKRAFSTCLVLTTAALLASGAMLFVHSHAARVGLGTVLSAFLVVALVGMLVFPNPIISALVDRRAAGVDPERADRLAGAYQGVNLFVLNLSNALANVFYAAAYEALKSLGPLGGGDASVLLLPLSATFVALGAVAFRAVHVDSVGA
ncbi:MAG: hypothetical protein Kow0069_02790 [Promethearchaeota archaeon]